MADLASVQARARDAVAKHNEILERYRRIGGDSNFSFSPELLVEFRGEIATLEMEYTHGELARLGNILPMNMDPTDPVHAIILAVRADLNDSWNRITFAIEKKSMDKAFEKLNSALGDLAPPKINGLPDFGIKEYMIIGAAILVLILLLRSR